jgi:hypothetical protein
MQTDAHRKGDNYVKARSYHQQTNAHRKGQHYDKTWLQ